MISLYKINEEQRSLYNELLETEGELTPEMEERMTINQKNFKEKTENYVGFLDSLQSESALLDAEIKRLQAKKKSVGNVIDRLHQGLLAAVSVWGNKETGKKSVIAELKVMDGLRTVLVKPETKLVVNDPDKVDEEYTEVVFSTKVDGKKLRKAIEDGVIEENANFYIQKGSKVVVD